MMIIRSRLVPLVLVIAAVFILPVQAGVFSLNDGGTGSDTGQVIMTTDNTQCTSGNTLFRSTENRGYLKAGEYDVYTFTITGQRSFIEWVLNGGCGVTPRPVLMMGGGTAITDWRAAGCGPDFNLYVYQNRDPRECGACSADRADTSSGTNAYVGWRYPCEGCTYSVVVSCRNGAGYYDLVTNSYVGCGSGEPVTMMGYEDVSLYTGENVAPDSAFTS